MSHPGTESRVSFTTFGGDTMDWWSVLRIIARHPVLAFMVIGLGA